MMCFSDVIGAQSWCVVVMANVGLERNTIFITGELESTINMWFVLMFICCTKKRLKAIRSNP